MDELIAWAAFAGAWLLVAGPLYQGALELREQDIDREGLEASKARVEPPKMPSPWWWLVPPVFYLLRRQRSREYRRAVFDQLTQTQKEQFASFVSKATGWFTVALGASLLGAGQTWLITGRYEWPVWLFWLLLVVMLGLSVLYTALRMSRDITVPRH
jgi:hypothetical protein